MRAPKIDSVQWLLGSICSATSEYCSFLSDSLQLFLQQPNYALKWSKEQLIFMF